MHLSKKMLCLAKPELEQKWFEQKQHQLDKCGDGYIYESLLRPWLSVEDSWHCSCIISYTRPLAPML